MYVTFCLRSLQHLKFRAGFRRSEILAISFLCRTGEAIEEVAQA